MKKGSLLLCSTLSLLATTTVFATPYTSPYSTRPNTFTMSIGGGNEWFSDKRQLHDTGFVFGAVGYNFTHEWGVELLYSIFNAEYKTSLIDDKNVRGNLYLFNVLYHFPTFHCFEPFILAGVGVTGLDTNLTSDANNEGNVNVGLGALYFIHQNIAFRAEARDLYTIVGGKNDFAVDAGMTFYFDLC